MKLRNKKTGEIRDFIINKDKIQTSSAIDCWEYNSLAELNEEWEDYEEPKNPYFINWFGEVSELLGHISDREIEKLKEAGNYFETKEEAEKAVEKLEALERLQKKFNFHITGWDVVDTQVIITTDCDFDYVKDRQDDGLWSDLDLVFNGNLLFGGEE